MYIICCKYSKTPSPTPHTHGISQDIWSPATLWICNNKGVKKKRRKHRGIINQSTLLHYRQFRHSVPCFHLHWTKCVDETVMLQETWWCFASFHVAIRRLIQHLYIHYSEGAVQTHIVIIAVIKQKTGRWRMTDAEGIARFQRFLVFGNIENMRNMVRFNQNSVLYFIKAIKIKLLFELSSATICKI